MENPKNKIWIPRCILHFAWGQRPVIHLVMFHQWSPQTIPPRENLPHHPGLVGSFHGPTRIIVEGEIMVELECFYHNLFAKDRTVVVLQTHALYSILHTIKAVLSTQKIQTLEWSPT